MSAQDKQQIWRIIIGFKETLKVSQAIVIAAIQACTHHMLNHVSILTPKQDNLYQLAKATHV